MNTSPPRYQTVIGAVSLVLGPALMSIGDLIHPAESWDAAAQVDIILASGSRWYAAHLLLFIGLLLFVPGFLALSRLVATRRPALGYVSRILLIASVGALSAVFVFEMVAGRFLADGGDRAGAITLFTGFNSGIMLVLMPGLLAFFIGTGIAVATLVRDPRYRWPALSLGLGAALILGEIISAQVLLSQIGNILILVAGIGFARRLGRAS